MNLDETFDWWWAENARLITGSRHIRDYLRDAFMAGAAVVAERIDDELSHRMASDDQS